MSKDNDVIQVNKEDLYELLIKFTDDHRQTQSNFWGEVKGDMKELKSEMKDMKDSFTIWQKEQDTKIGDLEDAKTEINSSFKAAKWVGGGAIGIILVLATAVYSKDKNAVHTEISGVREILQSHENEQSSSYQEFIKLLKDKTTR